MPKYFEKVVNEDGSVTARIYARKGGLLKEFTGTAKEADAFIAAEMGE